MDNKNEKDVHVGIGLLACVVLCTAIIAKRLSARQLNNSSTPRPRDLRNLETRRPLAVAPERSERALLRPEGF